MRHFFLPAYALLMNNEELYVSLILGVPCLTCFVGSGKRCITSSGRTTSWHSSRRDEISRWAWDQKQKAHKSSTEECVMCDGHGRAPKFLCGCNSKSTGEEPPHPKHVKICLHGKKFILTWIEED
jgi:hypothetical protein